MSREKWELAREVADAINRRDLDDIARLFHPEFEFHSATARAEGGVYQGVEGMRRYFADIDESGTSSESSRKMSARSKTSSLSSGE